MKETPTLPVGDIREFGTDTKRSSHLIESTSRPTEQSQPKESRDNHVFTFLRQWAKVGDDEYMPVGECKKILPAGLYDYSMSNKGPVFIKKKINVDDLIEFSDSISESVLQEIERFSIVCLT